MASGLSEAALPCCPIRSRRTFGSDPLEHGGIEHFERDVFVTIPQSAAFPRFRQTLFYLGSFSYGQPLPFNFGYDQPIFAVSAALASHQVKLQVAFPIPSGIRVLPAAEVLKNRGGAIVHELQLFLLVVAMPRSPQRAIPSAPSFDLRMKAACRFNVANNIMFVEHYVHDT
jgi:hypothetical protein